MPDLRQLARNISLVENDAGEATSILQNLNINKNVPVIGVTGPPGAGKSTLVSCLIKEAKRKMPSAKIAVVAVDPTSPFNHGSLLGDRLRMSEHFGNPDIFIRSLATRGALGGLSAKTIEITDVLRASGFDYIFIETVGVGQSEVEIASLADITLVVFVPESGDEIQTIKSGIMEIADIFVVNKSDREGADLMVKNLQTTMHEKAGTGIETPVLKTSAGSYQGIESLFEVIAGKLQKHESHLSNSDLPYQKAIKLLEHYLLKRQDLESFRAQFEKEAANPKFNLYRFVNEWVDKNS